MSDIQRRVVFYDNTGEKVRFWDFALVTTSLGTMVEPFSPGLRVTPNSPWQDFDPTDPANRIDEMRAMPRDKKIISGGVDVLHGGDAMPRVGP